MKKKLFQLKNIKLDHTGHRKRMRNAFIRDIGVHSTNYELLELLLNGYYTRCDTNYIARRLLKNSSLSELFEECTSQELETVDDLSQYLAVCGELAKRAKDQYPEETILVPRAMDHPDQMIQYLAPYVMTPDPRILYLCFNRRGDLTRIFFSLFGEKELPIALERCHLAEITEVIPAFSVSQLAREELLKAIPYYLTRLDSCPKAWRVPGALLLNGKDYRYLKFVDPPHQNSEGVSI